MVKVTINDGTLVGQKTQTKTGFEYFEFLHVPYAKPPIGDLRFKSPQPVEPWTGERDATSEDSKHISLQLDMITRAGVKGSEDCLYLNVYTPKLPPNKPLPVMVHIHGGGFANGSGIIKTEAGPDFLVEHNVVIVSINYRVNIFGFLNLDIPEAAGNMGLKDQVKALKWVKKNITYFGGDNRNVTLFGISAGGASIEYQLISPLSKDLFHKAIPQSGSPLNHWAILHDPKELAVEIAVALGYKGANDDNKALYDFLVEQPGQTLVETGFKLGVIKNSKGLGFGFVPSIEKDFNNGDAFLTELPYDILKKGNVNKVPILCGFCSHEGLLTKLFRPTDYADLLQNNGFLDFWKFPLDADDVEKYNKKFLNAYVEHAKSDEDKEQYVTDFFSGYDFVSGIWLTAKILADKGFTQYVYKFAYDGERNVLKKLFKLTDKGASHGDDTGYVFSSTFGDGELSAEISEADSITIKRITQMWTNFAESGNPTPETNSIIPVIWPVFDSVQQKHLVIDQDLTIETKYEPAKMAVFEELYKKYHK